jgi:hypothetical protein
MEEDKYIDEAFLPMFTHLVETTAVQETIYSDEEAGFKLEMEEMSFEMPIEMDVYVDGDGKVHIGSVPPLYYANTSLQPIYHQLRVTVAEEKEVENRWNPSSTDSNETQVVQQSD